MIPGSVARAASLGQVEYGVPRGALLSPGLSAPYFPYHIMHGIRSHIGSTITSFTKSGFAHLRKVSA